MPLGDDQPTLGKCFRDAGYRTGYVGKWNLDGGTGHDSTIDFETTGPGFVPPARRRGYDFWRGFNCGHDHHSGHPQFRRDGEPYRLRDDEYQPTVQTDIVGEFVDRNREDRFLCSSRGDRRIRRSRPPQGTPSGPMPTRTSRRTSRRGSPTRFGSIVVSTTG